MAASCFFPTFATHLFLNLKQGNEQLRIDGDLYPCAL